MSIPVRWGAATDAGRIRGLNEDNLLALPPDALRVFARC